MKRRWRHEPIGVHYFHPTSYAVQQTVDGGYIVAGYTQSFGPSNSNFWVIKLNSTGTINWQKVYGGSGVDEAYSIVQTSDLGYIVTGHTTSFGSGSSDFWVLKLDVSGNVTWQKVYGGLSADIANSISETNLGGNFVAAGYTSSFGMGSSDMWVLKMDPSGNIDASCLFYSDTFISAVNSTATDSPVSPSTSIPISSPLPSVILAVPSNEKDTVVCTSCSAPSSLSNNIAYDSDSCLDTGVVITWLADPAGGWGDSDTGTRTYDVLRDATALASGISWGTTSYNDNTGTNGVNYTYSIRYRNGCGFSTTTAGAAAADMVGVNPTAMATTAVDNNATFDTGVDISWVAPTDWGDNGYNAAGRAYNVYRDVTLIGIFGTGTLSMNDNLGTNNVNYTYHVDAVNGCGLIASYSSQAAMDAVAASNPGETSSPALGPMTAEAVGTIIDIIYTPTSCDTDHSIYWGIGTGTLTGYNWTNSECGFGDTSWASFDPGTLAEGSFFYFVIVGNNGTDEGSYGQRTGGIERPTCSLCSCVAGTQNLGSCP